MENVHSIPGGKGLSLHVREWGNPDGVPVLFIHGWSQNHMAWRKQYESALVDEFRLVALDLRGHGMSDKPLEVENYSDARFWANDIAAVIERLDLKQPVLVGWSYGGYVISDYLRTYGQSGISGLNFVGGGVTFNQAAFGTLLGPGFLNHVEGATQPDLPTNIEAIRQFLRDSTAQPINQADFERALAFNIIVPAEVRSGLLAREIDSDDVLKDLSIPVLVTQGREDQHCLPAMAEHILDVCPTATASWYEKAAHMPFMECADRFNEELAEFTRRVQV